MRLAQSFGRSGGRHDLTALFPMPTWQPAHAYTLDRALVFAFMRAEWGSIRAPKAMWAPAD